MMVTNVRPALAAHLHQRLQAFVEGFRQNVALIGPPGSGKTFQLQQLLGSPSTGLTLIYCPLFREPCRSFITRFLCAVLRSGLHPPSSLELDGLQGSNPQPLESLLHAGERQLPKTTAAIRSIEGLLMRRLHGEAFSRALDTVPTLIEERAQPCALFLDEFVSLEELGLGHAFHELGKRVMTWPSTLFILTSSSPNRARRILRERLQLLFGQFELLTLEALDSEIASVWVNRELKGVRGMAGISPFLIDWLGVSPWYLTVFVRRLKERVHLSQRGERIETLFLETAWDVLGSAAGPLHQWCASRTERLARLRSGPRALDALASIAQGVRTATELGQRVGRAGLSEVLQLLVEHDLAQRNGMCWMVPDPILRCWLSTIFSSQRAEDRIESAAGRHRFEAFLRAAWAAWVQTHQLTLPERVVRLLGRFRDDTVSLDTKTGRLPRFETITTERPTAPGAEAYVIADGQGRRWCVTVQAGAVDETAVSSFEAFCRTQSPRPSRKVVITKTALDENARLLAKAANMWVWGPEDLGVLLELYGDADRHG